MAMLDEGLFKDSLGNIYDLSSYIFIAITNVSRLFEKRQKLIGFSICDKKSEIKNEEESIREELRKIFTAPILNRFNDVVYFRKFKSDDAKIICKNLIYKILDKLKNKRINGICPKIELIDIENIINIIIDSSDFKKDGVRGLKNCINDIILTPILEEIVNENDDIVITVNEGSILIREKDIKKIPV